MTEFTALLHWISVLGALFPMLTMAEFQAILDQLGLTLEQLVALPVKPIDNGGILEFEKTDGKYLWFTVHPDDGSTRLTKWTMCARVHGYEMYRDLGCIHQQVISDILTLVRNTCTDQEEIVAP